MVQASEHGLLWRSEIFIFTLGASQRSRECGEREGGSARCWSLGAEGKDVWVKGILFTLDLLSGSAGSGRDEPGAQREQAGGCVKIFSPEGGPFLSSLQASTPGYLLPPPRPVHHCPKLTCTQPHINQLWVILQAFTSLAISHLNPGAGYLYTIL